jgi:conjugal transfer pilus assembly protein TraB
MSTAAATSNTNWWQRLPPKQKQIITIAGSLVGLLVVVLPFLDSGPTIQTTPSAPRAVADILPTGASRELGLAGLAAEVDALKRDLAERDAKLAALQGQIEENKTAGPAPQDSGAPMSDEARELSEEMLARLALLESRVGGGQGGAVTPPAPQQAPRAPGMQPPGVPPQQPGQPQADAQPLIRVPALRSITAVPEEAATAEQTDAEDTRVAYLPSGSIIQGVMLTGLDAPTGRGSRQDPVPVLVRIKHDAILPNRFRADIKECFMLLAGMGDLSSERAYLRGESFSCVREDGGVVDVPLNVYAVGEDGKAGLRGTLVSKQGQAIGKAMLAGIAQSTSQAFSRGGIGTGNTGSVDLNNAAESGLYGGAGSALDRVAQFYIDLAEQIFPVIEVSAGRDVSLVLVKGAEIRMVRS